jgi:hypothetical protein
VASEQTCFDAHARPHLPLAAVLLLISCIGPEEERGVRSRLSVVYMLSISNITSYESILFRATVTCANPVFGFGAHVEGTWWLLQ